MTSRRTFLIGAAAATLAPLAPAMAAPVPAPVPAPLAAMVYHRPRSVRWMLAEHFDDDGFAMHLVRDRNMLIDSTKEVLGQEASDGEVVMLRYHANYGTTEATKHTYDEEADDYPPITVSSLIPDDPHAEMHFMVQGDEYASLSLEEALDAEGPGTYTVELYAFSAAIPHRWNASTRQFIPLEPVAHDAPAVAA
jgi:hypothetical protein